MTKPSRAGYYVVAVIDSGTRNQRSNRLVGPFLTHRAALMMIEPVRLAAGRSGDDRFRHAAFTTEKVITNIKPGSLDLKLIDPADVIEWSATR